MMTPLPPLFRSLQSGMTRRLALRNVFVAAALGLTVLVSSSTAWAGDPESRDGVASAVSRLSAKELAMLKQRVPSWASLDAAAKERIARNVLHLRGMTSEQRKAFHQRLKRWKEVARHHPKGRRDMRAVRGSFELAEAFGRHLLSELPHETRGNWKQQGLPSRLISLVAWREFQSRVRNELTARAERDWKPGALPSWVDASAANPLANAMARIHELSAASSSDPDPSSEAAAKTKRGLRRARHQLGRLLLSMEAKSLRADAPRIDPRRMARRWMERFPDAYAATKTKFGRSGVDLVRAAMARRGHGGRSKDGRAFGGPGALLSSLRRGALDLFARAQVLLLLERMARHDAFDTPANRAVLLSMVAGQLHTYFGVPTSELESLPGVDDLSGRRRALATLFKTYVLPKLREHGKRRGSRRDEQRGSRRGRDRGDRHAGDGRPEDGGGPPNPPRPPRKSQAPEDQDPSR